MREGLCLPEMSEEQVISHLGLISAWKVSVRADIVGDLMVLPNIRYLGIRV